MSVSIGWTPTLVKDQERRDPYGGHGDGKESPQNQESYGETHRHLEPPAVVGDHDVECSLRERLVLVGVFALENNREVVPAHAEVLDLPHRLVERGTVLQYPDHGVLGPVLRGDGLLRNSLRYIPPSLQNTAPA
jgi:hypothetical protein